MIAYLIIPGMYVYEGIHSIIFIWRFEGMNIIFMFASHNWLACRSSRNR